MSENPRRGRQARNFTTNVPKILDLKSSSEQIFFRKLSLGAPDKMIPAFDSIFLASNSKSAEYGSSIVFRLCQMTFYPLQFNNF